jgi:hypothetical protein
VFLWQFVASCAISDIRALSHWFSVVPDDVVKFIMNWLYGSCYLAPRPLSHLGVVVSPFLKMSTKRIMQFFSAV